MTAGGHFSSGGGGVVCKGQAILESHELCTTAPRGTTDVDDMASLTPFLLFQFSSTNLSK